MWEGFKLFLLQIEDMELFRYFISCISFSDFFLSRNLSVLFKLFNLLE